MSQFNPCTLVLVVFILATGFFSVLLRACDMLSAIASFPSLGILVLFGGAYFTRSWKAVRYTLFYSAVLFGAIEWMKKNHSLLQLTAK